MTAPPPTPSPQRVTGPAWPKGTTAFGCPLPYREGGQYCVPGRWWPPERADVLDRWWGCPLLGHAVRDILIVDDDQRRMAALSWIVARDRADAVSDAVGNVEPRAVRTLLASGVGRHYATEPQRNEADRLAGQWRGAAQRMARNLGVGRVGPDDAHLVLSRPNSLRSLDRAGLLPRCLSIPPNLIPPPGYRERQSDADRMAKADAMFAGDE